MDNLTHTLIAVAISQTGLNRKTRFATLTLILAANAPDGDIVLGLKSGISYLHYHRGLTHSLLGITVLAIIIWALVVGLAKIVKPKPGLSFNSRWLLLAAFLGTGSHLLLDFTNSYGVRPFLPFSGRWYAWDIMPIIDLLLLGVLVLGLAVPWLLRLVSEEVGAKESHSLPGAVFCLVAMVALWGIRDFAHRRALSILGSHTYSAEDPVRSGAFPVTLNPFAWTGVVETESGFHIVGVNALNANAEPEEIEAFEKPQPSPALDAAMKISAARIFLDFARFPWGQVENNDEGYEVSFSDLRFYRAATPARSFTLEVELDRRLQTVFAYFYFAAPPRQ